jgi:hypothetical protein
VELVQDVIAETGPVSFADVAAPQAQVGPDAVIPA